MTKGKGTTGGKLIVLSKVAYEEIVAYLADGTVPNFPAENHSSKLCRFKARAKKFILLGEGKVLYCKNRL